MAPAANPNPDGSITMNRSTKIKAGTAINGCGNDVKTAHSAARSCETFLDVITNATARPSGILCTAKDMEMNWPNCIPLFPPKDTPIPIPSVNECNVITKTISTIFCIDAPSISVFKPSN